MYGISAATVNSLNLPQRYAHYIFEMRSDVSYTNNKIYVDAIPESLSQVAGSESTSNRTFNNGYGRLSGWKNSTSYGMPMDCAIFRIYNRSLSQSEILQNFNATKTRFGFL